MSRLNEKLQNTATILNDLHSTWKPHAGQIDIGKSIFYDGKKYIFCNCGRKFGKSEILIYSIIRWALIYPNSSCYYIAPFMKQAREIIWSNNRLQNFLGESIRKKYIDGINNTEMRITFKNGSFIKLDGSDNFEALRGINPHFMALDEMKDIRPEFWIGMEPNLAAHSAPAFMIGTPPENDDNHFWRIADSLLDDPDGAYFNKPSHTNPHISKEWLEKTKIRLTKRGELDVWEREYEAKRVYGGRHSLFPMYEESKHTVTFKYAIDIIRRDRKNWKLYCTADPATSSVFGVLFTAINVNDRRVIHLDELYVKETRETTSRTMWSKIVPIINEIHPDFSEWTFTCDEAAAWFRNEILDITEGDVYFLPTHKIKMNKGDGLSLIKDQMLYGYWRRTERCKSLEWEIKNYIKDDDGKIEKKNDHLVDCIYGDVDIETSRGPVAMKDIRIGDSVLTRQGYKKVTDHWLVGERDLVQIARLICTPDHRIITPLGVVFANELQYSDYLITIKGLSWFQRLSLSTALSLEGIQSQNEGMTGSILKRTQITLKEAFDTCIPISTKKNMARFLPGIAFTIWMAILLTTILAIFLLKSLRNTYRITLKSFTPLMQKLPVGILIQYAILLKNGILVKRVGLGTLSTVEKYMRRLYILKSNAMYADQLSPIKLLAPIVNFVLTNAGLKRGEILESIISRKSVKDAEAYFSTQSIVRKNPAALEKLTGKVYDLTVEDNHEFFAGGILVHNCLRYTNYADDYTSVESETAPEDVEMRLERRGYTVYEDAYSDRLEKDWTAKFDPDLEDMDYDY